MLPREATAVVNFRIQPGETVDSVIAHTKRALNGINVEITPIGHGEEPSNVTAVNTTVFQRLGGLIRSTFKDVVVAPALVLGETDSRHYAKIAKNTLRFSPILLQNDDLARIHGVDERISIKNYHRSIVFYYNLMKFW